MINGFCLISKKTSLGRQWVLTDTCILGENVDKIENESTETKNDLFAGLGPSN